MGLRASIDGLDDAAPEMAGEESLSAGPGQASRQAAVIARLRSRIQSLERHALSYAPSALSESLSPETGAVRQRRPRWELGCAACDALLPRGLEANAIHEIKGAPSVAKGASAADWMAGVGFAMRLAVRRIDALAAKHAMSQPWVLWCWPKSIAGEFGSPSLAGFAHLGLDPSRLIVVEAARSGDALNTIEESLKAASIAVVIGVLDELDLMPARRLSLAAGEMATPCLIVTHPVSEPAGATATRWRAKRLPSAPHRFDPRAPGSSRFEVALDRCRARPESAARRPFVLEWSDETRRFDLASVVARLPAQTRGTSSGTRAPAIRSY